MSRRGLPDDSSPRVRLDVGGAGRATVASGIPVLDEVLGLVAHAASFDLELEVGAVGGETEVDAVGRALGEVLAVALGRPNAVGLGSAAAPSDEALAYVALEASGRPLVVSNVDLTAARLGGLRGDLLARFLAGLAEGAGLTLHVRLLQGEDTEHVLAAIAKALGLALAQACSTRPAS